MARALKSIPKPTRDIPVAIQRVLAPMRDAIERRLLSRSDEQVITRDDMIRLGLATAEQLRELDR